MEDGVQIRPTREAPMLDWLVDNPNVVYVVFGLIVLGLGVSWWLNRRVRTLLIAAAVIALIALFWLLSVLIPTDRKQIQSKLWAMARAVLDRKPDDLAKHWAKDFRFQGRGRDDLAKAVDAAAGQFKVDSINLWEFDVKSLEDDKAEIWFRCVANAKDGGTFMAICKANFVKEGEQWKLQRAAFFQPIANTNQEIPLPIGP
jgi:hypothetical protein